MSVVPTGSHRAAWLEIDLDALRQNVGAIRRVAGAASLAPVVKAEAYGHGLTVVVDALDDLVDAFCVATLDEAIAVRAASTSRVLLLYAVPPEAAVDAVASGAELTLMSPSDLAALRDAAPPGPVGRAPVALQLCLETGFGRGGLSIAELLATVEALVGDGRFRIAGLWTHLASPGDPESAARQLGRFEAATTALRAARLPVPARHVASSGGIFAGTAPSFDLVRPGLAVYGVLDDGLALGAQARSTAADLRCAMTLTARPLALCDVAVGETIGYGGRWRADRASRVAILPLGYADGYLRGSQPGGEALVHGRRAPLVGVISMDSLAVDVTDVPGVGPADEFVLLGRQGGDAISVGELARRRNTIAWEVLSSMAPRLARVYHRRAGTVHPDT